MNKGPPANTAAKKKERVIPPALNLVQTQLYYIYRPYTQEEIDTIETWFTKNAKFLPEKLVTTNFKEAMLTFSALLGIHIHPFFTQKSLAFEDDLSDRKSQAESEESGEMHVAAGISAPAGEKKIEKQETIEKIEKINDILPGVEGAKSDIVSVPDPFLIFSNFAIDYGTARCMSYVWPVCNLTILKLNRNIFDGPSLNLLVDMIINPESKIKKLFFDWNPLEPELAANFYKRLFSAKGLEYLTLRGNKINDDIMKIICDSITSNAEVTTIRFIDFYDNILTEKGLEYFGNLLLENRTIECFGFARNNIYSAKAFGPLCSRIGIFKLSQKEYDDYKLQETERNTILEKNKKIKKKENQIPVPFLDPIEQDSDGTWSIVRNDKLKFINLAMNYIDDQSIPDIINFMNHQSKNFSQLLLHSNKFTVEGATALWKQFSYKISL